MTEGSAYGVVPLAEAASVVVDISADIPELVLEASSDKLLSSGEEESLDEVQEGYDSPESGKSLMKKIYWGRTLHSHVCQKALEVAEKGMTRNDCFLEFVENAVELMDCVEVDEFAERKVPRRGTSGEAGAEVPLVDTRKTWGDEDNFEEPEIDFHPPKAPGLHCRIASNRPVFQIFFLQY